MTTGFLGQIINFRPFLYYKIEENTFRIVPDNSKNSEACLIDTGYSGFLALPEDYVTKEMKFFRKGRLTLANKSKISVEYFNMYLKFKGEKIPIFVAFADIPEAIMGMQLISWFEKVTFDSVNSDVLYKRRQLTHNGRKTIPYKTFS